MGTVCAIFLGRKKKKKKKEDSFNYLAWWDRDGEDKL